MAVLILVDSIAPISPTNYLPDDYKANSLGHAFLVDEGRKRVWLIAASVNCSPRSCAVLTC